MSLADELLADLEEIAEEGDEVEAVNDDDGDIEDVEEISMDVDTKVDSITSIAKLRHSKELKNVMGQIEYFQENPRKEEVVGPVEADPEYQLIVQANNLSVEIDNEINIIHKFVRDHYQKRFPELESLVPTPQEYLRTVKELGNTLDNTKTNEQLQAILTNAVIMVVSVSASTTQGTELTEEELATVFEACDMAFDLNEAKSRIQAYVESRMSFIAPNLSVIVGSSTAAKIMGAAGGLTNLSKMPSCNILVLGAQRKTLSGFSSVATNPHTGYIYYSDLVQATNPDLRKKAARLVAGKCTLAARVDSFHESTIGTVGLNLREEIERRLSKLQEPPPPKQVKALPAPIDVSRKKRGGRRVRKMKEKLGMTSMRKAANRMTFGEIEEDAYQEDLGFSLGQVGKAGTGRIRGPQVDNKTQVKISKSLQRQLQRQQTHGGRSTVRGRETSGTASSVAFTPLQGLEIVNPQAAEKKASEENAGYFSTTSGFKRVLSGAK
ncbi:U4/U6 small nuclear ribonucleoprotein Prp31-like isoform X1 [Acanthaster planci]|uniref:U4/U6 small nuclear ribonucleoprotein Prp31 n=2 Tax=Acanthaster planci TaxID=133434 RepID=A0A8B7ZNY8_ACAPL|nr:U4/U6 small nuclear ribonucleoprotein Prp31-like isoform X1 [Acanthaster planci]XP_022105101.1 U4/U6 small nuclear ribonucleoprotein Prp31-like isoform X2 [Acanthaster planci]XP_022105102.1 U4/U6 small nuclear ribonucleoprotein Prp31-like isoform X1 [Acanthaster planci]